MSYIKGILCLFSAVVMPELLPGVAGALKSISEQKATGVGVASFRLYSRF